MIVAGGGPGVSQTLQEVSAGISLQEAVVQEKGRVKDHTLVEAVRLEHVLLDLESPDGVVQGLGLLRLSLHGPSEGRHHPDSIGTVGARLRRVVHGNVDLERLLQKLAVGAESRPRLVSKTLGLVTVPLSGSPERASLATREATSS